MPKTLLDCGNCGPDFHSIRQMVTTHFDVTVLQTHGAEDTLETLRTRAVDLVTVNRKLDRDYSDGIEIVKLIRQDAQHDAVPIMLVTNYSDHQDAAIAVGCVRGFGKLALSDPDTIDLLKPFLG